MRSIATFLGSKNLSTLIFRTYCRQAIYEIALMVTI